MKIQYYSTFIIQLIGQYLLLKEISINLKGPELNLRPQAPLSSPPSHKPVPTNKQENNGDNRPDRISIRRIVPFSVSNVKQWTICYDKYNLKQLTNYKLTSEETILYPSLFLFSFQIQNHLCSRQCKRYKSVYSDLSVFVSRCSRAGSLGFFIFYPSRSR